MKGPRSGTEVLREQADRGRVWGVPPPSGEHVDPVAGDARDPRALIEGGARRREGASCRPLGRRWRGALVERGGVTVRSQTLRAGTRRPGRWRARSVCGTGSDDSASARLRATSPRCDDVRWDRLMPAAGLPPHWRARSGDQSRSRAQCSRPRRVWEVRLLIDERLLDVDLERLSGRCRRSVRRRGWLEGGSRSTSSRTSWCRSA